MRDDVTKEPQAPKVEVDFSGKDFEETQKLLNQTAKVNSLNRDIKEAKKERMRVIGETFKPGAENNEEDKYPTPDDVIQYHLDKWETYESLERYLKGSLKDPKSATRVNEFFTHPVTGEVLELISNPRVKTDLHARTCVLHPASHTHRQLSDEQLLAAGVRPDLIRFSVGIENAEDIIADIEQALNV